MEAAKTVACFLIWYNPKQSSSFCYKYNRSSQRYLGFFSYSSDYHHLRLWVEQYQLYCSRATVWSLVLSLTTLLLFFSSNFINRLLGLKALFGLVNLIFSLRDLLVSLIILSIETHLQKLLSFRVSLIQVRTLLNLVSSLSLIGCTNKDILEYIFSFVGNLLFY